MRLYYLKKRDLTLLSGFGVAAKFFNDHMLMQVNTLIQNGLRKWIPATDPKSEYERLLFGKPLIFSLCEFWTFPLLYGKDCNLNWSSMAFQNYVY